MNHFRECYFSWKVFKPNILTFLLFPFFTSWRLIPHKDRFIINASQCIHCWSIASYHTSTRTDCWTSIFLPGTTVWKLYWFSKSKSLHSIHYWDLKRVLSHSLSSYVHFLIASFPLSHYSDCEYVQLVSDHNHTLHWLTASGKVYGIKQWIHSKHSCASAAENQCFILKISYQKALCFE